MRGEEGGGGESCRAGEGGAGVNSDARAGGGGLSLDFYFSRRPSKLQVKSDVDGPVRASSSFARMSTFGWAALTSGGAYLQQSGKSWQLKNFPRSIINFCAPNRQL